MTLCPRTVFGMPAYGRADTLARTLESLLTQTTTDLAVVIVDDRPTDDVSAIVERYARHDDRVVYEPNPTRLGMVGNWRRAFERSAALFPGLEYFAWVSDHDVWHPRWLEALTRGLDERPQAVLAYPQVMRVYTRYRRRAGVGPGTVGLARPADRLRLANTAITAGNAVYGLFRAAALARAGVFRPVLLPDRQILEALALFGEFVMVPEILWYREVAGAFSYRRQRRMFFATRAPLHTYLPVNVQHAGVLLWDLAIRGRGRPGIGRASGACYAALQWWYSTARDWRRSSWREALGATRPGRWFRASGARDALRDVSAVSRET